MSVISNLCDAVVTTINAHTWAETFTAVRSYSAVYDLAGMATLHVTVVPIGMTATEITLNGRYAFAWQVGIYVQKRTIGTDAADDVMDVMEAIGDLFRGKPLPGYTQAQCHGLEMRPASDPAIVDEYRVFNSVLVLTFRVSR
jgi:hypothetical protein